MTVNSSVASAVDLGDGVSKAFTVPFYFLQDADIIVQVFDNATGAETDLVLGTDYTVQGAGVQTGGSVTLTVAPAVGQSVRRARNVTIDQQVDYTPNDKFPAEVTEQALDKLTMICQQIAAGQTHAVRFRDYENIDGLLPPPLQRAGNVYGFDANGAPILLPIPSSVGAGDRRNELWKAGIDFTPGVSTSVTTSRVYGSKANLGSIVMAGVGQSPDTYSLSGTTLTFLDDSGNPTVIPLGVDKIWGDGGTTLSIDNPPVDSVGEDQLQDGAVTGPKLAPGAAAENLADSEITQESTGHFWASDGARIQRFNDRIFLGTATQHDGNRGDAAVGDWPFSTYPIGTAGAYEYMPVNGTLNVGAPGGQLAGVFYTRTSDGFGHGSQASIGVSSFVVNDNTTAGGAASWAFYGTTVRAPGAGGSNTNGVEIDVANLDATVPIYPYAMFPAGQTGGIGICAGGELGSDPSVPLGISSYALSIAQNDPSGRAKWEKGIVFAATAILGTDGVTGSGTAIALAKGHLLQWFNSSNQKTGAFFSSMSSAADQNVQHVNISDFGTIFEDGVGLTQFRVLNGVSNAANYLAVQAAQSAQVPALMALGNDVSVDLKLVAKGAGQIWIGPYSAGAPSATGYISVKAADGTPVRLLCAT